MKWMLPAIALLLASCGREEPAKPPMAAPPAVSADRAKDPICSMMVDKATALKASHHGADYFFCAEECRKKFQAEPASHVAACRCGKVGSACKCEHCGGQRNPCDCSK